MFGYFGELVTEWGILLRWIMIFLKSFFLEHVVPDEDENLGDLDIFLDFDFGTVEWDFWTEESDYEILSCLWKR